MHLMHASHAPCISLSGVCTVHCGAGKMFPTFCYRDEANLKTRFALSLGMCPRGEVGAGVIVVSLGFGIGGDAITIAVICLAVNLVMSSAFIMAVKTLADRTPMPLPASRESSTAPQWTTSSASGGRVAPPAVASAAVTPVTADVVSNHGSSHGSPVASRPVQDVEVALPRI